MSRDIEYYVDHFSRLNVDRSGRWLPVTANGAPHKPFLLLALIDLFSEGRIVENVIGFSYDLGGLFDSYWTKIMPMGSRGNLAYPFFHLKSSRFWHLLPHPGKEEALAATRRITSLGELQAKVLGARLDDELWPSVGYLWQHRERFHHA